MGRQKNTTRVKLAKAEYYELRARIRDVEAIELDAMKAAQQFAQLRAVALQRRNATFEALAKAHDFNPTLTYRWNDAMCELIAVPEPAA